MPIINDPMQLYATGILAQSTGSLALDESGRYVLSLRDADGASVRLLLVAETVTPALRAALSNHRLRVTWTVEGAP